MSDALPLSAMVDSSVFIEAFSGRKSEDAAFSADFISAMVDEQRHVIIAAPTLAEIKAGATPVPLVKGVYVVAFDSTAATVLAERMPHELIKGFRKSDGGPLKYYKYDAMIIACGLRWKVACLVTRDEGQRERAERVGLKAYHPRHFAEKQTVLPLVEGRPSLKSVP